GQRGVAGQGYAGGGELQCAVGPAGRFEARGDRFRPERVERVLRHGEHEVLAGGEQDAPVPVIDAGICLIADVGARPSLVYGLDQPAPDGNTALLDQRVTMADLDSHRNPPGRRWVEPGR